MTEDFQDFARAFGDALRKFLEENGISQSDASERLRLGKGGKARLSSYCHDSPKGTRPIPGAEILYQICSAFGFQFEYKGYRISAETLNGNGSHPKLVEKPVEQLPLEFSGQFDLTENKGTVFVEFKRPDGRVELSVRLKAAS